MAHPSTPSNESERGSVVEQLEPEDLLGQPVFEHVARALAAETGAFTSMVNLMGRDNEYVLGSNRFDARVLDREKTLCNYPLETGELFVVEDAAEDPRVSDHPKVTGEPHVRFYTGVPLSVSDVTVGTICSFDETSRELEWNSRSSVFRLVGLVERLLEVRLSTEAEGRHSYAFFRNFVRAEADIVRLDCEGCLDASSREILQDVRDSLHRAEQLAVEDSGREDARIAEETTLPEEDH